MNAEFDLYIRSNQGGKTNDGLNSNAEFDLFIRRLNAEFNLFIRSIKAFKSNDGLNFNAEFDLFIRSNQEVESNDGLIGLDLHKWILYAVSQNLAVL